ncbi:MAG TPA: TolC family protein [Gemmatimonadales bacterium]|jgi:outer membrane protein TolC|nr:TolC family protein [Gemmatimonadales bacterium]
MTAAVMLLATLALAPRASQEPDSLPVVTLSQAIEQAARLDANYVQSLGNVSSAEWGRRAARTAFVLPSVAVSTDFTRYSSAFFNIGTGTLQNKSVMARVDAQYELFSLRKLAELSRSGAALDAAHAQEQQARFAAAIVTESDYYSVLASVELLRSAEDRVKRAEEGLSVARARVTSGAAVRSDSLQLMLELTRARVDLLRQRSALTVARLELGRRVGAEGPVDAAPLDTTQVAALPVALEQAVTLALESGPAWRSARASERAASAAVREASSDYFPSLTVSAAHQRFDTRFFPGARNVSSVTLGIQWMLWNGGQREIALAEARTRRNVAQAIRADLERGARADVTESYEAYNTARASAELSSTAVLVAQENYRVQESRYRAGAATILDLLDAQVGLTQAEADLVQARYGTRLALAGLEAMLGQRLFTGTTE